MIDSELVQGVGRARESTVTSERQVNILVVDDREENLAALEAVLAPLGHNLVKATSGEQALRKLLDGDDYALILVDVRMPKMDGLETVRLIRQRKRHEDTAIIFLSAVEKEAHQIFRGYSAGAVDYVAKPVDPVVLRSKVTVMVDLHQKTAALKESEERFRTAFSNAPIGIALIAPTASGSRRTRPSAACWGARPASCSGSRSGR